MATLKSGRYEIPDTWNSATNGLWVLGKDTHTGKEVFIKEFRGKRYVDDKGFENLKRANNRTDAYRVRTERVNSEVGRIAGTGGDVVVTTDFFREGNFLYKVNEKIDFLHWEPSEVHEKLSVKQIDDMMNRLTHAIAALHGANILHCDLKPENVFIVEKDGTYVGMISDFDDSFFMNELPPKDDVVGTPEYMSPELAAYKFGDSDTPAEGLPLGPASDMFALGLIYHVYLTGELPAFDMDAYSGQFFNVLFEGGDYRLSDKLDAPHYALIQRLLVGDPAYRINNCTVLSAEINKIRQNRSKEYRLTLMDGSRPLANKSLPLLGGYTIGSGSDTDTIIEPVQMIRTDGKGQVVIKGLVPDMSLYIECGEEQRKIVWKTSGSVRECTLSVAVSKGYTIQVQCDGKPLPGKRVNLYRRAGASYEKLKEQKTTDAQGNVVFEDLPEGQYAMECDGIMSAVTFDENVSFTCRMKTHCLRLTRSGKPEAGRKVTLSLCLGDKKKKVKEGTTDSKGEFAFTFLPTGKKWAVSCDGKEELFTWQTGGLHEWKLPEGMHFFMLALLKDSTTPVPGAMMAIVRMENGKPVVLNKVSTDVRGQADMGQYEPGEYYIAVLSAPEGYTPAGKPFNHLRKLILPEGRERATARIQFTKEVVIENQEDVTEDIQIPESVSHIWSRLLRYKDGSILLVGKAGDTKKLRNQRQLGLYGLEQYKR